MITFEELNPNDTTHAGHFLALANKIADRWDDRRRDPILRLQEVDCKQCGYYLIFENNVFQGVIGGRMVDGVFFLDGGLLDSKPKVFLRALKFFLPIVSDLPVIKAKISTREREIERFLKRKSIGFRKEGIGKAEFLKGGRYGDTVNFYLLPQPKRSK